jgi:hypothetical protein
VDFWVELHLVGEITAVSVTGVSAGGVATFAIDGFGILMGSFSTSASLASGIQIIIPTITRTRITTHTRITITRLMMTYNGRVARPFSDSDLRCANGRAETTSVAGRQI